jgi:hypothetical protein
MSDAEVPEFPKRRRFTVEYKLDVLKKVDATAECQIGVT